MPVTIESTVHGFGARPLPADHFEHRQAGFVANDSPAVDDARARRQLGDCQAMNGKRRLRSMPLRESNRTASPSRRAISRKPSCLISWIQPGPLGGRLAGEGRDTSIAPEPRRAIGSRNKTIKAK